MIIGSDKFIANKIIWNKVNRKWLIFVVITILIFLGFANAEYCINSYNGMIAIESYPIISCILCYGFVSLLCKWYNKDMDGSIWFSYKINWPLATIASVILGIFLVFSIAIIDKIDIWTALISFITAPIIFLIAIVFFYGTNSDYVYINDKIIIKNSFFSFSNTKHEVFIRDIYPVEIEKIKELRLFRRTAVVIRSKNGEIMNLFVHKPKLLKGLLDEQKAKL